MKGGYLTAFAILAAFGVAGCEGPADATDAVQGRVDSETNRHWSIRIPPLFPYDPQFGANAERRRWDAPLGDWLSAVDTSFPSAKACEEGRQDLYDREYGRRTVSLRLYLDAVARQADPADIDALQRRAAEDSGHDDQLDHSRCIHDQDARLSSAGSDPVDSTYLLVQPVEPDPGEDLRAIADAAVHLRERPAAPLWRWAQFGAFDHPEECEAERHSRLALVDDLAQRLPQESYTKSAAIVAAAVCINVADARLRRVGGKE